MDQLICASLSHTHYWYKVGMLKVPVISPGDGKTQIKDRFAIARRSLEDMIVTIVSLNRVMALCAVGVSLG